MSFVFKSFPAVAQTCLGRGESAWIDTPEHIASRAQGNVQTLGDDTCTGYQVLLDNTRDAGRRTVRPLLSLQCTLV